MTRRAADLIVDCLAAHQVDRIFCVPGESYLAVLDALHDRNTIQTVICRHEGGAGFMGIADAKLTGRPGVVFVSRGPGATNASIAVHVAEQDAVPLVLFVGQVPRGEVGRKSFQEVDYGKTFADMAKAVMVIDDAARIPEIIARAFVVAQTPTPGAVVIVLPEDMQEDTTEADVIEPLAVPRGGAPATQDVEAIAAMIAKSERPLLIAGGGVGSPAGRAALLRASEVLGVPVALTFKRQDQFPNAHSNYAGHLGFKVAKPMITRFEKADLIIAVGTRLGEAPTQGYTFPRAPVPAQPLVHVVDDARVIGRNYAATKVLVADPIAFLTALAATPQSPSSARLAWIKSLHAPIAEARGWTAPADGLLDMGPAVHAMIGRVPHDTDFHHRCRQFFRMAAPAFSLRSIAFSDRFGRRRDGCGVPAGVAAASDIRAGRRLRSSVMVGF